MTSTRFMISASPARSGATATSVEVSGNVGATIPRARQGSSLDGALPSDISGQAEIAWQHIVAMLAKAGMTVHDLVVMGALFAAVRASRPMCRFARASSATPAHSSMLLVVPQLVKPEYLLEVEAVAAK